MNPFEDWDESQAIDEGWVSARYISRTLLAYAAHPPRARIPGFHHGMSVDEREQLALKYVTQRAREGSAYHIDTLMRIQLSHT